MDINKHGVRIDLTEDEAKNLKELLLCVENGDVSTLSSATSELGTDLFVAITNELNR